LLNYKPIVIYTTAYDQYAIDAFEQASIDYLLKPYPLSRLKAAVDKARTHWLGKKQIETHVVSPIPNENNTMPPPRLISKNGERITILSAEDVSYFTSEKGQTFAMAENKQRLLSETLDQLEKIMDSNNYVRVHRSYMININQIKEIQRWFNGKLMIIMNDEQKTEISTSRAGAEKLKQLLRI
jgi:two-component system LytT family response regulator/two-component system response regulator LytT